MASNSVQSLISDGYDLGLSTNGGIVSNWCDKRSATNINISCVLTGTGSIDGYWHLETSNAPENYVGITYGSCPLGSPNPVDTTTLAGSTSSHITAIGVYKLEVQTSARWVRAVFVSNINPTTNVQAYIFTNVPFQSP